jgi:enoyl reductase-like protein
MSEQQTIILKNKRIYNFYKSNPSISFEDVNLLMVDLLEKMLQTSKPTLDQTLANRLLEQMTKIENNMENTHHNVQVQLTEKLNELKKDYTTFNFKQ